MFLARGFNIQAFLVSDDILTTNVTDKLVELFRRKKGDVKLFTEIDTAKEWLLKEIGRSLK
jgi:hypothetical protein